MGGNPRTPRVDYNNGKTFIDGVWHKYCYTCQEHKPLDEFYTNKDGTHITPCKACRRAAKAAYQKAHPEKNREYVRRWYRRQRGQGI